VASVKIVAEFVERAEVPDRVRNRVCNRVCKRVCKRVRKRVRELGIDFAQAFFLHRPELVQAVLDTPPIKPLFAKAHSA
jgi:EAL domain-containing protein (putative c-di-GMP-specific phosphodiesterase class I)